MALVTGAGAQARKEGFEGCLDGWLWLAAVHRPGSAASRRRASWIDDHVAWVGAEGRRVLTQNVRRCDVQDSGRNFAGLCIDLAGNVVTYRRTKGSRKAVGSVLSNDFIRGICAAGQQCRKRRVVRRDLIHALQSLDLVDH